MSDLTPEQAIRLEALKLAVDGVGKLRFSAHAVVVAATKFAEYISDGAIPETEIQPERPVRAMSPGRPKRGTTGEGG